MVRCFQRAPLRVKNVRPTAYAALKMFKPAAKIYIRLFLVRKLTLAVHRDVGLANNGLEFPN